jgi:hypothetical protein
MTEYETIYQKLHAIYEAHRRSNHNPDSKQMCCMWSTSNPPDYLEGTPPLCDIEDAFEIDIDEDLAVELYDMHLDEAAKKIVEMQGEYLLD